MSSTYSPDLRLELIGTGDQAGVWGNTTNTNLGTLLENAVAGYTSVAIVASPQALTAYDGAEDQARYAMLALTTSTGANFTVCIPPNSKAYTFYNASSYTATITNATAKNGITPTGGTTVAIPAGKTMSVWSDGTNVAQQTNNFISPALTGTPTAPTATTGTNTTQVATTAFVQATLLASVYPVGSIYTNASNNTNPGTLLGFGTWTAFGAGRVMVGFDSGNTLFDTAEETGGYADSIVVSHTHTGTTGTESATHTHSYSGTTSGQSADHTHGFALGTGYYNNTDIQIATGTYSVRQLLTQGTSGTSNDHTHSYSGTTASESATHTHSFTTDSTGSSGTNRNYQPYITVYMWKRTA